MPRRARRAVDREDRSAAASQLAVELSEYLTNAAHQLRQVVDASLDVITLLDGDGNLIFVSAASQGLLGYRPDELVGRNPVDLVHPDDQQDTAAAFLRLMSGERVRHICRLMRRDGRPVWIEALARPVETSGVYSAVIRDITERREIDELLEHAALHDPVTGLPNRRMVVDQLAASIARAA